MDDLKNTVVAITGASAGIGRATARELCRAGARVVLGARRRDRLEAIEKEFPGRVVAVEMDVRSPDDNRRLVRQAIDRFGRLDSLVANAGIGMYGGILDRGDDELAAMLDTNIAGTIWSIRAVVPEMLEAGRGDIVIVASVAGFRGGANAAVYAATKFARPRAAAERDPGHNNRTGRDDDRVRDGNGADRRDARTADLPRARGHSLRYPNRLGATPPAPHAVLDDLEHGSGELIAGPVPSLSPA